MKRTVIFFVLGTLLCLSCSGYHSLSTEFATLDVPYVKGDETGELTSSIIEAITSSSPYTYDQNGEYRLEVEFNEIKQENIGFQYERNQEGNLENKLVPSENRLFGNISFKLIENSNNQTVLGPIKIEESVDYDFDFQPTQSNINTFSLGQISYIDEATQSALTPLYERFAHRLVVFLNTFVENVQTEEKVTNDI
jgi:hypothetical protein